jgi:hypothetical protein
MKWVRNQAMIAALALTVCAFLSNAALAQEPSAARENLMKACGDKWRTVREVETTKGVTWPQFLAACRAQASAASAPTATGDAKRDANRETMREAPASPVPASPVPASPAPAKPSRQAALVGGTPIFPLDIATRHASERPALGRQRTCADQFKANKSADANGGLKWIEKGGGYWSRCNAHLKQARA